MRRERPFLEYPGVDQDFLRATALSTASKRGPSAALPGWQSEIDPDALSAFLRYGYVPTPMCIYRGIKKLTPGTLLECDEQGDIKHDTYWSLPGCSSIRRANSQASLR